MIDDIVKFVSILILEPELDKKIFELAGPEIFTYIEFYRQIADVMNKKRVFVPIPMPILRPVVGIAEKTPFSPINLEQLSLFETDNVLDFNLPGFDYFKILPKKVISAVEKSL